MSGPAQGAGVPIGRNVARVPCIVHLAIRISWKKTLSGSVMRRRRRSKYMNNPCKHKMAAFLGALPASVLRVVRVDVSSSRSLSITEIPVPGGGKRSSLQARDPIGGPTRSAESPESVPGPMPNGSQKVSGVVDGTGKGVRVIGWKKPKPTEAIPLAVVKASARDIRTACEVAAPC